MHLDFSQIKGAFEYCIKNIHATVKGHHAAFEHKPTTLALILINTNSHNIKNTTLQHY